MEGLLGHDDAELLVGDSAEPNAEDGRKDAEYVLVGDNRSPRIVVGVLGCELPSLIPSRPFPGVSNGVLPDDEAQEVGGYMLGEIRLSSRRGGISRCRFGGLFCSLPLSFSGIEGGVAVSADGGGGVMPPSGGTGGRDRSENDELNNAHIWGSGLGIGLSMGFCFGSINGSGLVSEDALEDEASTSTGMRVLQLSAWFSGKITSLRKIQLSATITLQWTSGPKGKTYQIALIHPALSLTDLAANFSLGLLPLNFNSNTFGPPPTPSFPCP